MSRSRTSALAVGIAALALAFTACGDDDGGRISVDELSETIQEEGEGDEITAEQADCLAEAFVDSDISDEGLDTIVESPNVDDVADLDLSEEDRDAATAVVEGAVTECIVGDLEVPETTATTAGG